MMDVFVFAAIASDEHWPRILRAIRLELPNASILRVKDTDQAIRHLLHVGLLTAEAQIPDLILSDLDPLPAVSRLRSCVLGDARISFTPMIRFVRAADATTDFDDCDPSDQLIESRRFEDQGLELAVRDCIRRVSLSSAISASTALSSALVGLLDRDFSDRDGKASTSLSLTKG